MLFVLVMYNNLMKRSVWFWALAVIAVVGVGILLIPRNSLRYLNQYYVTDSAWDALISSRHENLSLEPGKIIFNGTPLQLDAEGNRLFYLVQPSAISYQLPSVVIDNKEINIATRCQSFNLDDIQNNHEYEILIYNQHEFRKMSLVLTTLPIMNIDTLGTPDIGDEDSLAAIQLYSPDDTIGSKTYIHLRGSTSKILEKQSFKLNLINDNGKNNKLSLLNMRSDDDWILNSLYGDFEKVRNILSAQLWKDCCSEHNLSGAQNSFEYRFVELFIDNSYYGLYLLGYKPDKKITALKKDEYLFKNRDWANANVLENDPNFERYYTLEESNGVDEKAAQAELLDFLKILADGNPQSIRDHFDIINAIDIELHAMLTAEMDYIRDGATKNLYVAIKQSGDRRYVMYTPWDFDLSFGNTWQDGIKNNTSTFSYGVGPKIVPESSAMPVPILRAQGDSMINDEVERRYAELRKGAWSTENIMSLINNYENDIFSSGAFYRDEARWPMGNYLENATDLNTFRNFVSQRLLFLDSYYNLAHAE